MICEICNSKTEKVEGVFVCEEGHVTNVSEVVEIQDSLTFKRAEKSRKKKEKVTEECLFEENYGDLMIFNAVFCEMKEFFDLKSESLFMQFINLVEKKDGSLVDKLGIVSARGIFTLVYLIKREELELDYKAVFISEYIRYIRLFPYRKSVSYHIQKIKKRLKPGNKIVLVRYGEISCCVYRFLFKINNAFKKKRISDNQINAINSIIKKQKNDMKIFFIYLDRILCDIGLEKTAQLIMHFRRFVYANNLDGVLFVPEIEVCIFLYEFLVHFSIEIDILNSYKRISERNKNFSNKLFITEKLSECIEEHNRTSRLLYRVPSIEEASKISLREFFSDYLGIKTGLFDDFRHFSIKKVEKFIDKISYD